MHVAVNTLYTACILLFVVHTLHPQSLLFEQVSLTKPHPHPHTHTHPPPPPHTHTHTHTHTGALLGWLVLKDAFGPLVYGIAFGLISGMMVFISLKELLPTARKFDKTKGPLVNGFLVTGMVVMALSLILFLY